MRTKVLEPSKRYKTRTNERIEKGIIKCPECGGSDVPFMKGLEWKTKVKLVVGIIDTKRHWFNPKKYKFIATSKYRCDCGCTFEIKGPTHYGWRTEE